MAKKVKAKKPVKKVLAKKAVSKKPAKKTTVKKPIKKTAPKAKKVIYKAPAKKIVKKVAAKKIVKKVAAKKPVAKAKKVIKKISKPAPKKIVKKTVSKKIIKKAVVKKAIKKTSKPAPKKIVKKIVSKKIIKKAVKVVSKAKVVAKKPIKPIKAIAKPTKNKVTAKKSTLINKPAIKSFIKPTISAKPIIEVEKTVSKFQPKPTLEMAKVALRYSDLDLAEFKEIIIKKVTLAKDELSNLIDQLQNPNANGGNDTDSSYQTLEDGQSTAEKEHLSLLAQRQRKFVENLENALVRIENKTYGICKETGKLIAKERLRAVPHTTLSMEAKLQQYR